MAVQYEEATINNKLVFVIYADNMIEALTLLGSNNTAVGFTPRNATLIFPPENATQNQIQEIRDALSESI